MSRAKIFTGARAKVLINGNVVGLFSNVSWSVAQAKVPNFILGRFSPAEITPVDQDAVRMSLSGYRVIDSGPYKVGNATLLKNLLTEEDFSVAIFDRQTNKRIFQADGCRVTGWSSGVAARGVSDIRADVIGMIGQDEYGLAQGGDAEAQDAAKLDDGA